MGGIPSGMKKQVTSALFLGPWPRMRNRLSRYKSNIILIGHRESLGLPAKISVS